MDNNENVIERLRNYVLSHPEMSKSGFLKGLDQDTGKVVIVVNGEEKRITIDELESGHLNKPLTQEEPQVQPISNQESAPVEEIEVMEDLNNDSVETLSNDNQTQVAPTSNQIVTLKDLNDAITNKNEPAVDKALESFALDTTGKININKAIKIVTDNCVDNVISCIRDNTSL